MNLLFTVELVVAIFTVFSGSYCQDQDGTTATTVSTPEQKVFHRIANKQYTYSSAPIMYQSSYSYSAPVASANYGYSSSSAQNLATGTYGGSSGNLISAGTLSNASPVSGGATSYGGSSSSSSYTNQAPGSASSIINTLYGYGTGSQTAQLSVQNSQQTVAPAPVIQQVAYGQQAANFQSGNSVQYGTGGYGNINIQTFATTTAPRAVAPQCAQSSYNLTLPDNVAVDTIILRIVATDPQGLPLSYQIIDSVLGAFSISGTTGDIFVDKNLVNFAQAMEFTVQVMNSRSEYCVSVVRINFIQTARLSALTASTNAPSANYYAGSGYGGGTYQQPSAPLIAQPPTTTLPSSLLYWSGNYGGNSQPNAPAAPLIFATSSAPIIRAPAPSPYVQPAPAPSMYPGFSNGGGYGGSANLVQTPAPTPAPVNFPNYNNVPPIFPGSGSYGANQNIVAPQVMVTPPAPVTFPNYNNVPPVFPGSGSYGTNQNLVAPQVTVAPPAPVTFPTFSGGSGYGGGFGPVQTPSQPAVIRTNDNGNGGLGADSLPQAPTMMNWSFFVPNFNGTQARIGTINGAPGSTFSVTGNPFFSVSPSGDVFLASNYCPSRTPMQETVASRSVAPDGSVVQGNISVVIFAAATYLKTCTSVAVPPTGPPMAVGPTVPTIREATSPVSAQGGASVSFLGDTAFTITQCDSSLSLIAASIRAKFSPNIDFSRLRITVSNNLFKPALPVVCDATALCNITLVFAQPIDVRSRGSYLVSILLEGGGLNPSSQQLQVSVQCSDPFADNIPAVPARRGPVDPSAIVPPLPPCGAPSLSADISEDVPVGTVVTTLPANSDPNFKYQLSDSSATGYFDLSDRGALAVSSPLFEPTVDSVFVRAVGLIGNNTVCGTDIYIGISNVNRNRPVFDQLSYNFAIDCALPMSLVGSVSASDIDAGRNNIRRFFINPDDTAIASIDPASGGIHLRNRLTDSTSFNVFVENPGTNLKSSAVVQISCTGANQIIPGLSRSADRLFATTSTTTLPPKLRTEVRSRPVATSNKPISYPFSVTVKKS